MFEMYRYYLIYKFVSYCILHFVFFVHIFSLCILLIAKFQDKWPGVNKTNNKIKIIRALSSMIKLSSLHENEYPHVRMLCNKVEVKR